MKVNSLLQFFKWFSGQIGVFVLRFLRTVLNSKELEIQMKDFQLNTKIIFIGSKQVFYLLKFKNLKTEQVNLKIGLLSIQFVHQSEIQCFAPFVQL
jgi:hypothetical protein